jgi:2-keto-4-pentenoate hydratase
METERMAADPRVASGLKAQFAARQRALAQGAEPAGWKIGINAPPVMERLEIAAPVVGHLTSLTRLAPGVPCDIGQATRAALEPEIAIHVAADLPGDASVEDAAAAIGALGGAIEVVDIDLPFDDLEAILAGNVFHHSFLLGPPDSERDTGDLSGIGVAVSRDGDQPAVAESLPDPGQLAETVAHVAGLVASQGELLRAGDVIIAGSLTAPLPVSPGDSVEVDFEALGSLQLDFA